MNGELLVNGYKFKEKLLLNLQNKTVLLGSGDYLAVELFTMLENYFTRKNFSPYYSGTTILLNGNKLSGNEFLIIRLKPTIDLSEEIKITKKSIMGQFLQSILECNTAKVDAFAISVQDNILDVLNSRLKEYKIAFEVIGNDITTISKMMSPVIKEADGQDILEHELDQFYVKTMLLDFITRLKTDKKIMLLMELPEYGLKEEQVVNLFKKLGDIPIDNIVIYTKELSITASIPQIYNYNVIKDNKIYGFDDYDILERNLLNAFAELDEESIRVNIYQYIFNSEKRYNQEFAEIIDDFFYWNKE